MSKREVKLYSEIDGQMCRRKIKTFSAVAIDPSIEDHMVLEELVDNIEVQNSYEDDVRDAFTWILMDKHGISEKAFVKLHNLGLAVEEFFNMSSTKDMIADCETQGMTPKLCAGLLDHKLGHNVALGDLDDETEFEKWRTSFTEELKSFSDRLSGYPDLDLSNPEVLFASQESTSETRMYSVAALKARLRERNYPPRKRFKMLMRDYMKYYKTAKSKLSSEDYKVLQEMFVADFMNILGTVSDKIMNGANVSTLIGAGSLGRDVADAAKKLSPVYKKSLNAEKALGDVPKAMYQKLTEKLTILINALKAKAFDESGPGITEVAQTLET